jgi:hypothetical protein
MKRVGATGAPAHDVARAPPRQSRRTRPARARRGTEIPSGSRPAPTPLCTRGRDTCVEAYAGATRLVHTRRRANRLSTLVVGSAARCHRPAPMLESL